MERTQSLCSEVSRLSMRPTRSRGLVRRKSTRALSTTRRSRIELRRYVEARENCLSSIPNHGVPTPRINPRLLPTITIKTTYTMPLSIPFYCRFFRVAFGFVDGATSTHHTKTSYVCSTRRHTFCCIYFLITARSTSFMFALAPRSNSYIRRHRFPVDITIFLRLNSIRTHFHYSIHVTLGRSLTL